MGLTNVVGIAAGGARALALRQNGTVAAWGSISTNETNFIAGLSNVMSLASGYAHSAALKNNGSVVTWGDDSFGQTNGPFGLSGIKKIAANGNQTLAVAFSPLVSYPVNVSKDLLLIYNTNSPASIWVENYYLAHRPMVSNANVLGIGYAALESINRQDYTNCVQRPILGWLAANPTKRPQYWIMFLDVPSRISACTNDASINPNCYFGAPADNSVSYELYSTVGFYPFITHINMGTNGNGTNDCKAYIDKLSFFGTNYAPGQLIIGGFSGSYGKTNYYFDDTCPGGGTPNPQSNGDAAKIAVLSVNSAASVIYSNINSGTLTGHILNGLNVAGYMSWGVHGYYGDSYWLTNSGYVTNIAFIGHSSWWPIHTVESFNGQHYNIQQGNITRWWSYNAFGSTNYENTPVGAISYTDEPSANQNNAAAYFGLWESGKRFAICAWNARSPTLTFFQVVGDPFVSK